MTYPPNNKIADFLSEWRDRFTPDELRLVALQLHILIEQETKKLADEKEKKQQ